MTFERKERPSFLGLVHIFLRFDFRFVNTHDVKLFDYLDQVLPQLFPSKSPCDCSPPVALTMPYGNSNDSALNALRAEYLEHCHRLGLVESKACRSAPGVDLRNAAKNKTVSKYMPRGRLRMTPDSHPNPNEVEPGVLKVVRRRKSDHQESRRLLDESTANSSLSHHPRRRKQLINKTSVKSGFTEVKHAQIRPRANEVEPGVLKISRRKKRNGEVGYESSSQQPGPLYAS